MVAATEGTIPFLVDGEEFQTYYKIYGTLSNSNFPPLIGIHGGPGLVSYYLSPLSDLASANEKQPVILYDQLGNGKSSRLRGKPAEFFTVKLYVDELENLIQRLGVKEYHLLGHSWGGPLAAEFEVERHPPGLKSPILTNSLTKMRLADKSFGERIATLDNLEEVMVGFQKGWEDPKAMRKSFEALHARYAARYVPEGEVGNADLATHDWVFGNEERGIEGDNTVSVKMFESKKWTIADRIHKIEVPVLLVTTTEDMIQSYASEGFFWGVKKVKWINLEHSTYLPFWEERENYMGILRKWLDGVNAEG